MSVFCLIHGGWHAAWCWDRIVPLLQAAGHLIIAPDLPGHGTDTTPLSAKPYNLYVPSVRERLASLAEPAIVVGHSSGGMIITEAARQTRERIKALVYLSAFLIPPGKTPRDVMIKDTESLLGSCLEIDQSRSTSIVKPECARKVFYDDCSEEDADWATSRLQPEPLIPPAAADGIPAANEAWVHPPRFYIECLQDKALGPKTQRRMYSDTPCDGVYSLPTSHSPFLSAPQKLLECLLDIDKRVF